MEKVIINADGASRGNPGPAAIGATIKDQQGILLVSLSRAIGVTTNNQAEYQAIIAALEKAIGLGARAVDVSLDSLLVVKQVMGQYRVKNPALKPLFARVKQLQNEFTSFRIRHVTRRQNQEADHLANQALDGH